MGNVYCALNHDRKEAFHLGKSCIYRDLLTEENERGETIYKVKPREEIVRVLSDVWALRLPESQAHLEATADALIAFDVQDIYEECDDVVLDFYQHYVYAHSVYEDDPDIGKTIHEFSEGDQHVWEGFLHPERAPHLNR